MTARQFVSRWASRWPLVLTLAGAGVMAGCQDNVQEFQMPPPSVEVATVQARPFEIATELPGRVEPVRVAEVRARVPGIVLTRNFDEGADVQQGDVLFQIDPAPFEAALAQARGELARAEAELNESQAVVGRYEPLVEIEAVSSQDFDAARGRFLSAQAAVQSARAGVQTAQLDLDYATVKAPISGRIGRALVTEGALVGQGEATPMAIIQQLDPVYIDVRQSVADMVRMREALADGRLSQGEERARISVRVDGTSAVGEGHLLFSDITVDRSTGQVAQRGEVPNDDYLFLPGMYVRVQVSQGTDANAILVPQRAVRRGFDGQAMVLMLGEGDVAEARPVTTGAMHGAEWHIIEGLAPGERIIVDGMASPGDVVNVVSSLDTAGAAQGSSGAAGS